MIELKGSVDTTPRGIFPEPRRATVVPSFKGRDLDDLPNGGTYGRVLLSDLSGGHIILATGVGDLDDIDNGTTYGRVLLTDISAGHILLSETVGDLDDVADGTNYGKVALTSISAGKIIVAGLDSGVTARMFTDSTTKTNIEAWRHASDVTLIDGGDIYAGSITTGKLTAVPTQLLWNGGFELGLTDGWDAAASDLTNANITLSSDTPAEGKYKALVEVTGSHTRNRLYYSHWFPVSPDEILYLEAQYQSSAGFDGSALVTLGVYDGDKANVTWVNLGTIGPGGTAWTKKTTTTKVGSGKAWARVALCISAAATTGTVGFDAIKCTRASEVIVHGTPGGTRTEITADHVAGYNGTTLQWEAKSSDGKLYAGAGAIILDSEGIHRNTVSTTLYDLVINRDVVNEGSASDTTNVSKGCFYTIWASFQQHTDLNARYVAELKAYDSNNALAGHARFTGVTADFASSSYPSVFLPLTFYSGPTGGSYTPYIEVVVRNYTGGTKGFWVSLWTRKIL